jgi:hypothetical protein
MIRDNSKNTTSFKLESADGTVLGTITIPWHWAELICINGVVTFFIAPPMSEAGDGDAEVTVRQAVLVKAWRNPDALKLFGATLEEFERLPGCSFAPSAAYLRSIIE